MDKSLSPARKRLFLGLTLFSPVLFFIALELLLRIVQFGDSYPLFVDAKGMPGYLQANLKVINRYFPDEDSAPDVSIDTIYFKKQKPADGLRLVVQGGSSAAGFPYGRWGGLAGMLNDRLQAALPEQEIEVITTAMSAVNSYTLLDFADEIIDIQPDAVLIYAGHNEYLGVMGAASALSSEQSREATLLYLKLRKLRVYQLVQKVIAAFTPQPDTSGVNRGTLMARAASNKHIPSDSETYRQGQTQLHGNLDLLLSKYQQAGIPVYIATLASNEGDQRPFVSEEVTEAQRPQWQQSWKAYRQARQQDDLVSAEQALLPLTEAFSDNAKLWFTLAELKRAQGELDTALQHYLQAKDLDQLRFRAPEAFNQVIHEAAEKYGAQLVDVQAHLRRESSDGIIGDELMLEHLHPNARGYFLLADAFYQALKQGEQLPEISSEPTLEQAYAEISITEIDRILADHKIRTLKADFPFTDRPRQIEFPAPKTAVETLAAARFSGQQNWIVNMQQLLGYYRSQQQIKEAMVVARMLHQAFPNEPAPTFATGMLLMNMQQYQRARPYLERCWQLDDSNLQVAKALVFLGIQSRDKPLATRWLEQLKIRAPKDGSIASFQKQINTL